MKAVFLIVLFILTLSSCGARNDYQEYTPIFFVAGNLIQIPDSLTAKHKKNIEYVFKYYNVDFKIHDNKVFYKGDINKELMWNYTLKANDTSWLNSH